MHVSFKESGEIAMAEKRNLIIEKKIFFIEVPKNCEDPLLGKF